MKNYITFILLIISSSVFAQVKRDSTFVRIGDSIVVTAFTHTPRIVTKTVAVNFNDTTTTFIQYKIPATANPNPNQAPIVTIQNVGDITLPLATQNLVSNPVDPDGTITGYLWEKLTGGNATITTATAKNTSVQNLVAGTYTFRITVTDNDGAKAIATVSFTVNPEVTPPLPTGLLQGYGSQTPGGTGQQVVHVKTLTPAAMTAAWGSNRTIVFDVSGTITGWKMPSSPVSFVTIDGTSNPVTFMGSSSNKGTIFAFDGSGFNNIIVKNIRVRGAVGAQDNDGDGINVVNGAHDIVFDHVSSSGNNDGNLDITSGAYNVTVQNCILGGGLSNNQTASWWSGTMLIAYEGTRQLSVHHNFFSPKTSGGVSERSPYVHAGVGGDSRNQLMVEFTNNVVYNWGNYGSGYGYNSATQWKGNYYKSDTNPGDAIDPSADPSGGNGSVAYLSGNFSANGASFPQSNHAIFPIPTNAQVTTTDACTAAAFVKASAGARPLDAVDQALLNAFTVTGCSGNPNPDPVACTGYIYSSWSTCSNGTQSRTVTGFSPSNCTGSPAGQPVLTQACTPNPGAGDYPGYTKIFTDYFNKDSDLDPQNHGQAANGFIDYNLKFEGAGSFASRTGNVSSGTRSEVQLDASSSPTEGIADYYIYYKSFQSSSGHDVQLHPGNNGSGTGFYHVNGKLVFRSVSSGTDTYKDYPFNYTPPLNKWIHVQWYYKWAKSGGYSKIVFDGVILVDATNIQVGDGSSMSFKLGQNYWSGSGDQINYDKFDLYKKN